MSTRALYTFTDENGSHNVYKHHDGYPSGARDTLKTAIDWFAWQLPRFEADEFAAAFVTAGKIMLDESSASIKEGYRPNGAYRASSGGGVRLMPNGDPKIVALKNCADIQFRYEISCVKGQLHVKCFSGSWWDRVAKEACIFKDSWDKFNTWSDNYGKTVVMSAAS